MTERPPANGVDWEAARSLYESTRRTADEIAAAVGSTATRVIAYAGSHGWTRDRMEVTVQRTAELASKELAVRQVASAAIAKVNLEMRANALKEHRTDIAKARALSMGMFEELATCELELDTRSTILKRLADSMKTFILLERQAFGIVGAIEDPEKPVDAASPENAALDLILNKFASVLQKTTKAAAVDVIFEASTGRVAE
jgi:hypothetical protein